jgi:hypothetical protein
MARIQNNVADNGTIFGDNVSLNSNKIEFSDGTSVKALTVRLTYDDDVALDLNGLDWSFSLGLEYV